MAKAKNVVPEGFRTVTPALTLNDAAKAIDWYKKALGAEEVTRAVGPDGKIMHAVIKIGDSSLMLGDAMMGSKSAMDFGGTPMNLWIYVADCDALFNRAVGAGAQATMPVADQFWGDRFGAFTDPFGYRWSIATHKEDLTPDELEQRQNAWLKEFAGKM